MDTIADAVLAFNTERENSFDVDKGVKLENSTPNNTDIEDNLYIYFIVNEDGFKELKKCKETGDIGVSVPTMENITKEKFGFYKHQNIYEVKNEANIQDSVMIKVEKAKFLGEDKYYFSL